ncbi:MAG TPA: hypothetical protein VF783_14035 [Terriglobales bacterium]
MTNFLCGTAVGYITGLFVAFMVLGLVGRKPVAPTMHRRKYRDLPLPETKPSWAEEVGGVRYEHLGMTGEEA